MLDMTAKFKMLVDVSPPSLTLAAFQGSSYLNLWRNTTVCPNLCLLSFLFFVMLHTVHGSTQQHDSGCSNSAVLVSTT